MKVLICIASGITLVGLFLVVHTFVQPAYNVIGFLATAGVGGSGIPALVLLAIPWLEKQRVALEAQYLEE